MFKYHTEHAQKETEAASGDLTKSQAGVHLLTVKGQEGVQGLVTCSGRSVAGAGKRHCLGSAGSMKSGLLTEGWAQGSDGKRTEQLGLGQGGKEMIRTRLRGTF